MIQKETQLQQEKESARGDHSLDCPKASRLTPLAPIAHAKKLPSALKHRRHLRRVKKDSTEEYSVRLIKCSREQIYAPLVNGGAARGKYTPCDNLSQWHVRSGQEHKHVKPV